MQRDNYVKICGCWGNIISNLPDNLNGRYFKRSCGQFVFTKMMRSGEEYMEGKEAMRDMERGDSAS